MPSLRRRPHSHTTNSSAVPVGRVIVITLLTAVGAFYGGLTLGAALHPEGAIAARVAQGVAAFQQQQQQQQQPFHAQPLSPQLPAQRQQAVPQSVDTDPRFPVTVQDFAVGLARVNRDALATHLNLGVPLDPSRGGNAEVLLLYQHGDALPTANPYASAEAKAQTAPPQLEVTEALEGCDYLNLILTDHGNRKQCLAIMGQYEAFHVQKYMRVAPTGGKLDATQALRFVNRGYHSSGRTSLKPPTPAQTRAYQGLLQAYLTNLDATLERLAPLAAAAAANSPHEQIIVLVCNQGQAALLLNFLCSAQARGLDTRAVLVFCTDVATYELVANFGAVTAFYDQDLFGDLPTAAARRYADPTFRQMMLAKVWCVHLTLTLGYSVLFQDVDVQWYRNPLDYFTPTVLADYDVWFQDDGNHALYYAPYSANTGFYYLQHSDQTLALVNTLLRSGGDYILATKSHQIPMVALLQEQASLHGLRIKIWPRTGDDFPGGHAFHHRRDLMKAIMSREADNPAKGGDASNKPYIFHMSWTKSKDNKIKFYQQMGEWYLADDVCLTADYELDVSHTVLAEPQKCCVAVPTVVCHYRDKPSKIPCPDSPTIDKNGRDFW
jgi:hypothetical protein